jgi:hypothetical protein
MKVNEVFPEDTVECQECSRTFTGRRNAQGEWVSKWKQLAGHIMASPDHINKRWAMKFLLDANVGTGLHADYSRWY